MEYFFNVMRGISLRDILDILIVTFVFYRLFMLMRETRAEQLMKGIVIVFIFAKITGSDYVRFYTINWFLEELLNLGTIALLIVFQPELRRALENLGRSNVLKQSWKDIHGEQINHTVEEIVQAISSLSRQKIGALIVFEQYTGLNEVIETGTPIEGELSMELLINIFIPNTPLHDGALIVKGNKIRAAGCFLPSTDNQNLPKELGTRHRAAIGVTERSDAISLVVSEETGSISIAERGELSRYLDEDTLRSILLDLYMKDDLVFLGGKWRRNDEDAEG